MNTSPRRSAAPAWQRFACGLFLLVSSALAQAQEDPPGRVARLNHAEGAVTIAPADTGQWTPAELNRPLTGGDRVWTDQAARSELHVGSTALRMDSQTSLDFMQLDEQVTQIRLNQGRINVRVRQLWEGERLEIDTPNLAFVVNQPGDYRIEVDPTRNLTRVAAASGAATLYGESGESTRLGASQQLAFTDRNLNQVRGQDIAMNDAFDRWTDERDRREDQSVSARYVSRETIGYQQLDAHGDWQTDATYGPVWYPRVAVADWAPYRYGQWRWISPWGWTWVDDAPWGFAPFHYGRWAQVGPRWAWVPGPIARRPVYAPALVGFAGSGGGVQWNVGAVAGRPDVGWFPLGPGEPWRPGFRASSRYIDNVNRPWANQRRPDGYMHQNRPGAMTAVPAVEFDQRRPVRGHWLREREPGPGRPQAVAPLPSVQPALPMVPGVRDGRGTYDSGRADPDHRRGDDRARAEQERARNEQFQREQQERAQQRQIEAQNPRLAGPQQGPHEQALRAQMQREQAQREQAQRDQSQRERMQRDQQAQREHAQREQHQQQQQQIQARQQAAMDQAQRQQLQMQRDQAQRERAQDQQREQQERAMRQQQEHQVRVQRQQQDQAERVQRQAQEQQQRAQRQQQQEKEMAERMRGNGREGPPARLQPNR